MNRSQDIEAKAAEWLIRREQPQWSQADQAALDGWLNESMSHKAGFWRLEHAWQMADRIGALSARDITPRPRRTRLPLKWWQAGALAASLLLAVAVIGLHFRPTLSPQPSVDTFDTGIGGYRIVALVDGSRIELNTATILRTMISKKRRDVWLDRGEAFFQVAHVAGSAFVVHAGPRIIIVVGTKFSVRRDGDKVTVAVVEGRVRVEDTTRGESSATTTVTPGDVAIALGSSTIVISKPVAAVEDKCLHERRGPRESGRGSRDQALRPGHRHVPRHPDHWSGGAQAFLDGKRIADPVTRAGVLSVTIDYPSGESRLSLKVRSGR
jgi:transmembrane sensor